jgi:hypothetical protein
VSGLLEPRRSAEDEPFWTNCAAGVLSVQRCDDCGSRRFPPCPMCGACGSLRRSWVPVSGQGTVWSVSVAHPPLLPAYAEQAPYVVVVVSLAEDPSLRMVGNVLARPGGEIGEMTADEVHIGYPVRVTFVERGEVTIPQWLLERQGA